MFSSRGAFVAIFSACAVFGYHGWLSSSLERLEVESEAGISKTLDDSAMAGLKEAGWTVAAILVASSVSLATKGRWKRQAAERRLGEKVSQHKIADAIEEFEEPGEADPSLLRIDAPQAADITAEARTTKELAICLRQSLTARKFEEGLASYDRVAQSICAGCTAVWSMLLYCALEANESWRCEDFIWLLLEAGDLNANDFVNMVRHYVNSKDAVGLTGVLCALTRVPYKLDQVTRNRALGVCLSAGDIQLAETLIDGTDTVKLDVVAYNTLIRLYGHCGDLTRCRELVADMKAISLKPTDMTFGIMIDACVKRNDVDGACDAFWELKRSGLTPNVVHYTAFMQGLVCAQRLDEAERLLDEMVLGGTATPDVVTYGTLMKAYSERGAVDPAVRLLKRMQKQSIEPDCVMFNTALNACSAKAMIPEEVLNVFDGLVDLGLRPNTATLSVIIKALVRAQGYSEAVALLRDFPSRFEQNPAPRIFEQLVRACRAAGRIWEADHVEALARTQHNGSAP